MRVPSVITVAMLASAFAQAEPLPPPSQRIAERYRQMLAANPGEGIALERLWKGALDGGTTEELLAAYAKAEDFSGRMISGLLLRKAGRDDGARAAFEGAAKTDAANPLPLLALARMENDGAYPAKAAALFERALGILPKDDARMADTLMQLGAAWSAAGEPAKAAQAWERVAALAPDDPEVRRRLAQAGVDAGMPDIALKHLEFLATRAEPSERPKALQQIAAIHSAAARNDDAMQALERAVRGTAPGSWLRAELLGQIIRLALRTHSEAALEKKWLAQAGANPRDLGGYLQLVEFYDRTGNPAQQRVWLEKVAALVPGNADHALRLARLLAQMDLPDAAAVQLDKVIAAQPRNTDIVFERARLDVRCEDGAAARQRIAVMLAAHRDDDLLRSAVLAFFQEHRMHDEVGRHLAEDARAGAENALLSLSEFYFSQKKSDEGRAALARLVRSGDAPAEEARRRLLVAQHLKGHGELTAAVAEAEAAVRLAPEPPDFRGALMMLGELRAVLAQRAEARIALLRAYAASGTDAERMEVDGKLFESIRAEAAPAIAGRPQGESAAAVVEGFIRDLMREANDAKSPAGWLRVARWKAWNGDKSSAITFAVKAADMEPENPAAREFLAHHAVTNDEGASAVAYLRELIALNPAGRAGYLREIAQIGMQRGEHADALEIFAQLVKSNPGSMDALADLATAQERADKAAESAATWRNVLALAPAPRRREAASSLLRVLEKTGAHEEATELMLRGADDAADERTRFARLDELLLYCQRHARLPWARGIFEKRRAAKADDFVSAIALGRVLKLMGERAAASELFTDAALSVPNDADVLPELIREAEELRKLELAVRLQEQFLRTSKAAGSDGWLRLAALQEGRGDVEAVERTWAQAVAKFPRDADVLRRAADFHLQWGDRTVAATLLGKFCALDATDARAASELGELHFAAGKFADARAAFERVMKLTPVVTEMAYPGQKSVRGTGVRNPQGVARRPGGSHGAAAEISGGALRADVRLGGLVHMRLGALGRLAEIARNTGGAVLREWIADWMPSESEATSEALWALYFSGAHDAVLAIAEKNAVADPADGAHWQAFIRMALEGGAFARLGAWLNAGARTVGEAEIFARTFEEVLWAHPEIVSAAMMANVFPEGGRAELWACAEALARTHHTREAIVLGKRVFANTPQRAATGRELARWHLAMGEAGAARAVLAAACEGEGESLDSPLYGAMRDLYFLLAEQERAAFVTERLRSADGNTAHGLQVRMLLLALEGRSDDADAALAKLLGRHPSGPVTAEDGNTAVREWNFTHATAAQLVEWEWPALARRALDMALADAGLHALQEGRRVRSGRPGIGHEIAPAGGRPLLHEALQRGRAQRDALAYLAGGAIERETLIAKMRGVSDARAWSRFAEALAAVGGGAHAVAIWRIAWEIDPQNPGALRQLADASRNAGDVVTDEAVRRRCLGENINPGNETTLREFALELADLIEGRGAADEALAVIEMAVERNPEELRLLMRMALLLERSGRTEEAAPLWKKMIGSDGGSAPARRALAGILDERGKFAEAIEVRNRSGPSGDTALPELFCKAGRTDEALVALPRLMGGSAVQAAMAAAETLALKGDGALARSVLVAAMAKTTEPSVLMQGRAKLLTIPGFPPSRIFLTRMQERMRDAVRSHPELAGGYFEFFERYATRLGIAEEWGRELDAAWNGGAGSREAGVVLLRRACGAGDADAARQVCVALLARPDVPDSLLDDMGGILRGARRADLQLPVAERVAQRAWPSAAGMFKWVRLLVATGSRERAAEVLTRHAWLAGFGGGAEALGRAWMSAGDMERAREFLSLAMRQGGPTPAPSVLVAMARVHVAANNFRAARLLLRRAFAEPVCHEYAALAEYLDAAGELARWREAVAEFALAPRAAHELALAIFSLHEKRGRVREALALVAAQPSLVSGADDAPDGNAGVARVDLARLRRVAVRAGEFEKCALLFQQPALLRLPAAAAETESLRAAWAERRGDAEGSVRHAVRAAELHATSWEFARSAAGMLLARSEPARAREVLGHFLAVSPATAEREAAIELWEQAGDAMRR